jgi:hypothetical protein
MQLKLAAFLRRCVGNVAVTILHMYVRGGGSAAYGMYDMYMYAVAKFLVFPGPSRHRGWRI